MERLDSLLDLGRGRSIACRDLILVSLSRIRLHAAQAMLSSNTVTHSQVVPLVRGRSAGLRLLTRSVFKAFGPSPCVHIRFSALFFIASAVWLVSFSTLPLTRQSS